MLYSIILLECPCNQTYDFMFQKNWTRIRMERIDISRNVRKCLRCITGRYVHYRIP